MEGTVWLAGRTILVGKTCQPISDGVIEIQDGRIQAVGCRADFGSKIKRRLLRDYGKNTILPGLINSHLHLALNGDDEPSHIKLPRLAQMDDRELVPLYLEQAQVNLRSGVTTVRDLHPGPGGSTAGMRIAQNLIDHGLVMGSRVLLSLRPLVIAGGHGNQWLSKKVSGAEEIRRAVRENIEEGADVIKVMTADKWGELPRRPNSSRRYFTREELAVAVETAHRGRVPISAHAHGEDVIRENVEAGFDSIEHGSGMTSEVAELMATRETFLVPTLSSFQNYVEVAEKHGINNSLIRDAHLVIKEQRKSFEAALRGGVRIAAGNDAGFPFQEHGSSLVRELELYCELGMSPVDAICTATSTASALLNISDSSGAIEVGKRADLLIVEGNPAQDISALRSVVAIYKEGLQVV